MITNWENHILNSHSNVYLAHLPLVSSSNLQQSKQASLEWQEPNFKGDNLCDVTYPQLLSIHILLLLKKLQAGVLQRKPSNETLSTSA